MRLFITAALVLAALFSNAQGKEKKARKAVRDYIKNEKGVSDYKEVLFGPLEDITWSIPSPEEQEIREIELRLMMDSLFSQAERDINSAIGDSTAATDSTEYKSDPELVKRLEELRQLPPTPSRQEKGYKMLHMLNVRSDGERVTIAMVIYFDLDLKIIHMRRLEYDDHRYRFHD